MLIKHIPTATGGKRAGGGAVFRRVADYIENKPEQERGRTLTADCVLDVRSAAMEMESAALQASRCKEPAMHIVMAWQPGERPTEQQQREAVQQVLKNLRDRDGRDMTAHQWVAVLHKDTDHEHLHLLVNKVHPETGRTVSPEWSHRSLDKAGREIEAAQGWKQTPGLMKWNDELSLAIRTPPQERAEQQARAIPAPAAAMEKHSYSESLYGFIKSAGVEKELRQILSRNDATWADVQYSLGVRGLELRRSDRGGYTITDGTQQAKASEAARSIFSGKESRARLEGLGGWVAGDRSIAAVTYSLHREPQHDKRAQQRPEQQIEQKQEQKAAPYRRDDPAAQEQREQRKTEREAARKALYERYQGEKKAHAERQPDRVRQNERAKAAYAQIRDDLKFERERIRQTTRPRSEARAVAQSVAAFRSLERRDYVKQQLAAERKATAMPAWRDWVASEAQAGDKAAQSQMRGWQYAQQRTPEPVRQRLEESDKREHPRNDGLTAGVEWRRRWFLGGVEYKIDGRTAVIDKGDKMRVADGKGTDDRAIALGIALQAEKRGGIVKVAGNREFKDRVADIAAERGIYAKFEDRKTQARYEQRKQAQQRQPGQSQGRRTQEQENKQTQARRPSVEAVVARQREQQKQEQKQKRVANWWRV